MEENKKTSGFGVGLLIGAIGGMLAGILYAPKSGKQTRKEAAKKLEELKERFSDMELDKKVRDVFGTVSEETKDLYLNVTKEVLEKVSDVKERIEEIDTKKYQKMVDAVLKNFKARTMQSAEVVEKLRKHLVADWNSLFEKKAPTKKGAKKSKKGRK